MLGKRDTGRIRKELKRMIVEGRERKRAGSFEIIEEYIRKKKGQGVEEKKMQS